MQSPPIPQDAAKNKRPLNSGRGRLEDFYYAFISLADTLFAAIQSVIGIKGMAYLFVLPNLLIFGIFILFPMLLNFGYAFTGGTDIFLDERPYVGTRNVEQLFQCEDLFDYTTCREDKFIRAVGNTLWFVTAQVSLMVIMSLITALVLNRNIIGRGFFRSVFFYPVLLSPIVVALMWRWILTENGILNAFLVGPYSDFIGLMGVAPLEKIDFISDFSNNSFLPRMWVVIISVWSQMGFYTLILLAGLQAIPSDLYEAADIDGAGSWDQFWGVTLPLLMPTMLVVLVLSLIRAVQVFDIVFAFTDGGPGTATLFIVQYIYDVGFGSSNIPGMAAAASLVMASALIVLTIAQITLRSRQGEF
ncbi:MAG: sugar ABC transporter permease [Phototrophicaceae bacterium]